MSSSLPITSSFGPGGGPSGITISSSPSPIDRFKVDIADEQLKNGTFGLRIAVDFIGPEGCRQGVSLE